MGQCGVLNVGGSSCPTSALSGSVELTVYWLSDPSTLVLGVVKK